MTATFPIKNLPHLKTSIPKHHIDAMWRPIRD
jgi:hypothetical protein